MNLQSNSILLLTPPLTQLNAPYPATTVLKGFLKKHNYTVEQADLGIELIDALFSASGLEKIFSEIDDLQVDGIDQKTISMQSFYIQNIHSVKEFLKGRNPSLAYRIATRNFLPEGPRFKGLIPSDDFFGSMGVHDKAKYLATLFIEDVSDLIRKYLHPGFDLIRYQSHLAKVAPSFDPIYHSLINEQEHVIDQFLFEILDLHLSKHHPKVVGVTVPFPGNLYGALICAQHIKKNYPEVVVVMGGGYITTELRELTDTRIFEFADYLIYDDGELPFINLLQFLDGKTDENQLHKTLGIRDQSLVWFQNPGINPLPFAETGVPDFSGLPLDLYFSLVENVNPMHKLWTDGFWNKMTLAHGCYWAKCAFCDTQLEYIKRYDAPPVELIIEKMKSIIAQTGQHGFHFTDEAAPPILLKNLALAIIKNRLQVTWWGNIRFEKAFTPDLCQLLAASGCIAVTGGIETASDRLLQLMNKGVTLEQAAQVTHHFSKAGILVHAYLMFGFPSQTQQETIDSLEIVRQMFEKGLIQSAFWHRFALTCHSPVSQNSKAFGIQIPPQNKGAFANNELHFTDPASNHQPDYTQGLNKATYNFMHRVGFDFPLHKWFDDKIPSTALSPKLVQGYLKNKTYLIQSTKQVIWMGGEITANKQGNEAKIYLNKPGSSRTLSMSHEEYHWLQEFIDSVKIMKNSRTSFADMEKNFEKQFQKDILSTRWFNDLRESGLLLI